MLITEINTNPVRGDNLETEPGIAHLTQTVANMNVGLCEAQTQQCELNAMHNDLNRLLGLPEGILKIISQKLENKTFIALKNNLSKTCRTAFHNHQVSCKNVNTLRFNGSLTFTGLMNGAKNTLQTEQVLSDLSPIENIETLYLNRCNDEELSVLAQVIAQHLALQNCKTVTIQEYQSESIPAEFFSAITHIDKLYISESQYLKELPETLGELTQLKFLSLDYNLRLSIPNTISTLKKLIFLRIECSEQLKTVPIWIGELTQLKTLDLRNNDIINLPQSIQQLTQLETLQISGCKFEHLPETIQPLTQLKYLKFACNRIQTLPAWLKDFEQLEVDIYSAFTGSSIIVPTH